MKKISFILIIALLMVPLVSGADEDRDGIPDESDIYPGDYDNDGMPDKWEKANGLNYADPTDADIDSDNDGISNYDEYLTGGNPIASGAEVSVPDERFSFIADNKIYILSGILGLCVILFIILVIIKVSSGKKNQLKETVIMPMQTAPVQKQPVKPSVQLPPLQPRAREIEQQIMPSREDIEAMRRIENLRKYATK